MPGIDEAWVRQRAHEIWEAEGRPQGKDFDHWCAATEEFRALTPAEATNGAAIARPAVAEAVKAPAKKPAARKAKA